MKLTKESIWWAYVVDMMELGGLGKEDGMTVTVNLCWFSVQAGATIGLYVGILVKV